MNNFSGSQPFPRTGHLARNMNLELDDLRQAIGATQAKVYIYIVATVKNQDDRFVQTGSAPNFQGDVITLCTCKHMMRTFLSVEAWPDNWIAGFTSISTGKGKNALIYLMKVGVAFDSHYDLWYSERLSDIAKQAKAAHHDKYGDVYQPRHELANPFDYQYYIPPVTDHVHIAENCWHADIDYIQNTRRAALLVGDNTNSFMWTRPMLYYPQQLHRGQKKTDLQTLITQLVK